ncbi:MAG: hypothetical protein AB8H80_09940 [Planctomycetota bacterium]
MEVVVCVPRWVGTVFGLLLCVVTAATQQRRPIVVRVVDSLEQPVSGCRVTVAWSPGEQLPGVVDVVRGHTDARGRCVVKAVPGRLYSAWAIGPADDGGVHLVSEPIDAVASGGMCDLVLRHEARPRSFAVSGLDECSADPDRSIVYLPFPAVEAAVTLRVARAEGDDGDEGTQTVRVPVGPHCRTWVAIIDGAGTLLQAVPLEPDDADRELVFSAPDRETLAIHDGAGNAIAGGVHGQQLVRAMFREANNGLLNDVGFYRWLPLPTRRVADIVEVDIHQHEHDNWLMLKRDGYMPQLLCDRLLLADEYEVPMHRELVRCWSVLGVAPRELVYAHVRGQMRSYDDDSGPSSTCVLPVTYADGQLRCAMPSRFRPSLLVLHLVPGAGESGSPRVVCIELARAPPDGERFDLASLARYQLQIRDEHGGIGGGAQVGLSRLSDESSLLRVFELACAAGLDGRLEVLLGPEEVSRYMIYATDGRAHAAFTTVRSDQGLIAKDLALEPVSVLTCRVVDVDGAPVAGAYLEQDGPWGFGGALRGAEGWTRERVAIAVAWPMLRRARSDKDGVLRGPVQSWVPWSGKVRVRAGALRSTALRVEAIEYGDVVVR